MNPTAETATRPDGDDTELLRRARAGDGAAFAELVGRHEDTARGLLRRMLGPRAELDDLLQDARVKALTRLDSFRGDAAFGSWFCRIALHGGIDALRRRRREIAPLVEDVRGPEDEPWRHAQRVELRERMARAVDRLPAAMQQAFRLYYREGLDTNAVAERLSIPVATVRTRLFHARRRLREALHELVTDGS